LVGWLYNCKSNGFAVTDYSRVVRNDGTKSFISKRLPRLEVKERKNTMSDVSEKMFDEQQTVELTEEELEEVTGAWGDFFPSNNSTSLAVTSIAFTTNNSSCW